MTSRVASELNELSPFAQWHELRARLGPLVGERMADLYAYSVGSVAGGPLADRLRGALSTLGDDVDSPQVTETERLMIDWGIGVARGDDDLDTRLDARARAAFSEPLRRILIEFAALTYATSLVAKARDRRA